MTVLNKTRRTTKSLSNWGASAGRVLQLFPSSRFVLPASATEALVEDAQNLSDDMAKIGRDISSTLSSKEWIAKSNNLSVDILNGEQSAIRIKVIGVGGGGGNALAHMIESGMQGVEFICANTDAQALNRSKAHKLVQLGANGLGVGSNPKKGREAAELVADEIRSAIRGAHMLFIAAGMGGGTGTGASPVIASIARELGIFTVAVVTKPFEFEGVRRILNSEEGLVELETQVDSLIAVPNEKLLEIFGDDVSEDKAFGYANDILKNTVKGIAETLNVSGSSNIDFEDVRAVLSETGQAFIGVGVADGAERARYATNDAITSPLLFDANLSSAKGVLVLITTSKSSLKSSEAKTTMEILRKYARPDAHIIYGAALDDSLADSLRVTVFFTGLNSSLQSQPVQAFRESKMKAFPHNRAQATDKFKTPSSVDRDDLEIPAFLRKQAD